MPSIKYIKLKAPNGSIISTLPIGVKDENVEITDATIKKDDQGNDITVNTLAKAMNEVETSEIDALFENSGQS